MKRVAIVSPKEIAKDQGKPLSKYERNMMIFDWLHTLGKIMLRWIFHFITLVTLDESVPEASETADTETEKDIEKKADAK